MGQIELEHRELFALEFGKIAEYDCLHSHHLQNNWSYLVLNCEKLLILLGLLSNIYKYKPVSTKLGHNEYEHKTSDEFSSHTRSVGVLSP